MSFVSGAPIRVAELYRSGVPFWRNWAYTRLVEPVHIRKREAAEFDDGGVWVIINPFNTGLNLFSLVNEHHWDVIFDLEKQSA